MRDAREERAPFPPPPPPPHPPPPRVPVTRYVCVQDTGIENLTWTPRTVADVEAVCAGKITSRLELFRKF